MSDFLFTATPNQDAIRFLKDKAAVSRAVFDGLLPEMKARAITVTGLESTVILKKLRDRIADLPAGANWDDVKGDLVKDLSPLLNSADDPAAAERRATTLLRLHGFQAYAVAQERIGQRQKDVFPFAQYADADDPRVRPTHSALDGIVLPVDSEFWRDHTGPWEYGCRCRKIFLSHDDVAEIEQEDAKKIPEARRVISGARRDKLEKEGTFLTADNGVPRSFDVRGPRAKFGASGYSFDPGSMELSLDDIKARYKDTPEVWANFETWATKTKIGDGRGTVMEWLKRKLPSAVPPDGWPDLAKLKDVKALGGSTGARLVRSPEGRQFVRKLGASPAHLREEFTADQLYRALGADVPASKLYEQAAGPVKLAEFIEGRTLGTVLAGATPAEQAVLLAEARKHFVADALLGNYDVAGLSLDNLLVDATGKVWRIDNGGALRFRAQGAPKAGFGPRVTELDTLRDPKINAAAARLFAGLGEPELRAQLRDVVGRRATVLAAAPAELRAVLGQRFDDLQSRLDALGAGTDFTPEFAAQVAESRILGKAHLGDEDKIEDLHVLWFTEKRGDQDYTVARFKLTPAGGTAVRAAHPELAKEPVATDPFWNRVLPVVTSIAHHAKDGAYNPAKVAVLAKVKADLAAAPAALREHYEGVLAELEAAMQAKRAPKLLTAWQPPAPKVGDGRGPLVLTPSPWALSAKSRVRGHAQVKEARLMELPSAIAGTHAGTRAEIRAVLPDDASAPFALRGTVEIAVPGRGGLAAIRAAAEAADSFGTPLAPATPARRELTYLTRNLSLLHKQLTPAQRTAWQKLATVGEQTDAERSGALRAWIKEKLAIDVGDGRAFAADGAENAFGFGWRHWDRWDLPRAAVEKEMAAYTLHHELSGSLPDVLDSWLNGGGQVTPTVERLRVGVSITSGKSPSTDLGTGGASYFFTRIKPEAMGRRTPGLTLKVGNLSRLDAVSYSGDKFGDVRPVGENTHMKDMRTARNITPDEWKAAAVNGGNETLFKNGFHLLNEVDNIIAESAAERDQVLGIFEKHGYTTLPDGRAIADIVTHRGIVPTAKKKK